VTAQSPELRTATIRLLVIPFTVYTAWLLEIFLLAGSMDLFKRFDPPHLFLYTLIACILTGIVVPLLCVRIAFISGTVNLFQIGFRTLRRTGIACTLTGIICYGAVIFLNPFGTDRFAFAQAFLFFLPGAIASVINSSVLAGTHVHAFVRGGGMVISIAVGIMVTALLFGMTTFAYFPTALRQDIFFSSVSIGIITAVFFFAVRDVYSTSFVVGVCSVFTMADRISPHYLQDAVYIWINALLAIGTLVAIHLYLSRNYVTLEVPRQ
jgi:hypothetical protein